MRSSKSFDITVSQLIFNGSYIVGLQTSKIYKNLSSFQFETTQDELIENVVNSYFNVLIAKENNNLLKDMLANMSTSVNEMQKMYAAGMIDETTYLQISINELTLKNALNQLERQTSLADKLLKFQLGAELNDSIILTDNLEGLIKSFNDESIVTSEYTLDNDWNYKLIKTQENLMKQNYNLNKTNFLPSLSGYYLYHKNLNEQSVDFVAQDQVGIKLSVPIFSSGERIAQLSQARISYEQAKNNTEMTSKMLIIGFDEAKSIYLSSLEQINYNLENMNLTEKVYHQTIEKNKSGMASGTDLSQSQTQFLTAQKDYYMSVIQLVSSRLKLDKALNKL
jgi:outer membrane protein